MSDPASIPVSMSGTSSGGCVLSASIKTTVSASPARRHTSRIPVRTALASPWFRACRTVSSGTRRPAASAAAAVPSLLPSSITRTRNGNAPVHAAPTRSSSGGRLTASL